MRRKFVWDAKLRAMVEVSTDYRQPRVGPDIWNDTPDYVSPVSGLVVSGRKQRREDLRRTGSRPWEGMEQERKEAERRLQHADERSDRRLEEGLRRQYHQMSPERRRILEGR